MRPLALSQLEAAVTKQDRLRDASSAAAKARTWCTQQLALLKPQMSWIEALRRAIPEDGILINELTQVGYVAPLAYPVYGPRTFITPGYQGTLGYGMPTGLGAAIGNPDKVTVAISGDGGFGWNLQELATAAKYSIPLIMVVFVDGAFGNVRRIQQEVFNRQIGTELHNPDFHKLADAFGVTSTRANVTGRARSKDSRSRSRATSRPAAHRSAGRRNAQPVALDQSVFQTTRGHAAQPARRACPALNEQAETSS